MIKPLADRIVVKPVEVSETSKGGILMPENSKEKPNKGIIMAIGSGKMYPDGHREPLEVQVNDTVIYNKFSGTEITTDEGEKLLIMKEEEILAVV